MTTEREVEGVGKRKTAPEVKDDLRPGDVVEVVTGDRRLLGGAPLKKGSIYRVVTANGPGHCVRLGDCGGASTCYVVQWAAVRRVPVPSGLAAGETPRFHPGDAVWIATRDEDLLDFSEEYQPRLGDRGVVRRVLEDGRVCLCLDDAPRETVVCYDVEPGAIQTAPLTPQQLGCDLREGDTVEIVDDDPSLLFGWESAEKGSHWVVLLRDDSDGTTLVREPDGCRAYWVRWNAVRRVLPGGGLAGVPEAPQTATEDAETPQPPAEPEACPSCAAGAEAAREARVTLTDDAVLKAYFDGIVADSPVLSAAHPGAILLVDVASRADTWDARRWLFQGIKDALTRRLDAHFPDRTAPALVIASFKDALHDAESVAQKLGVRTPPGGSEPATPATPSAPPTYAAAREALEAALLTYAAAEWGAAALPQGREKIKATFRIPGATFRVKITIDPATDDTDSADGGPASGSGA